MICYGAMLGLAATVITMGDVKAQALLATSPVVVDTLESGPAPGTLHALPALVQPAAPSAKALPPAGNPLWGVPLKSLSVTRERPLFSPSRRPLAPPVFAAAYSAPAPAPKPREPDHPLLSLVGTVAGASEGIGIFLDEAKAVVRLKTGQDHDGWILRSVHGREVTFDKGERTATLALPVPGAAAGAPGVPAALAGPAVTAPAGPAVTGSVANATWRDGDGRMIVPPSFFPQAAAPAASAAPDPSGREKEL